MLYFLRKGATKKTKLKDLLSWEKKAFVRYSVIL